MHTPETDHFLERCLYSFWNFHCCVSWVSLLGGIFVIFNGSILFVLNEKLSNNWSKPRWYLEKKFGFWVMCLRAWSNFPFFIWIMLIPLFFMHYDFITRSWHFTELKTLWALTIFSWLMASSSSRPLHFNVERTAKMQKLIYDCLNICGEDFVCNYR